LYRQAEDEDNNPDSKKRQLMDDLAILDNGEFYDDDSDQDSETIEKTN
jgi:hypothetical protein